MDQSITVRIFDENDPVSVEAALVNYPEDTVITSQTSTVQGKFLFLYFLPAISSEINTNWADRIL